MHDTSDSGGTLFVEPLAVVEASNRVREAIARELTALSFPSRNNTHKPRSIL